MTLGEEISNLIRKGQREQRRVEFFANVNVMSYKMTVNFKMLIIVCNLDGTLVITIEGCR